MTAPLGQPVKITFETFSDAAKTTHTDPTTAAIYVKDPTGAVTPHVWSAGDLTRDALGKFSYTLPDTAAGLYLWRAAATGTVTTSTRAGAVSVDTAFPPMLVSLDDIKAETNITSAADDDELTTYGYSASALLLNHPSYAVADACQTDTPPTEWHNGGSRAIILLRQQVGGRIATVTEYIGATAQPLTHEPLDGGSFTGYGWDYEDGTGANGMLVRLSSGYRTGWYGNRVKVTYSAGSAAVPYDIRLAVLALIDHLWEMQRGGSGPGLQPGLEVPDTGGFPGFTSFALPNRVKELLTGYQQTPAVA